MCVHSPSRVPGSDHDRRSPRSTSRGDGAGGGGGAPGGRSRTTASTASATATPSAGRGQERGRPAGAVQQRRERHRGEHLPELADEAGELGHHRYPARREPRGDHRQHADERQRVARAHQHARGDRERQRRRQREQQLARGHRQRPGHDQHAAAEPVEQQADGHLQAGVDQQLQHHEAGQGRGPGGEPVGGVQPRHAERGAVHHADHVGGERDRPDDPHPARRRRRSRRPRPVTDDLATTHGRPWCVMRGPIGDAVRADSRLPATVGASRRAAGGRQSGGAPCWIPRSCTGWSRTLRRCPTRCWWSCSTGSSTRAPRRGWPSSRCSRPVPGSVVARFDVDQLVDYRSRRPPLRFETDRWTALQRARAGRRRAGRLRRHRLPAAVGARAGHAVGAVRGRRRAARAHAGRSAWWST